MSEGPEKERPDGGGTNPDESMLTEQENRAQPIEHKANVEATRERQLLEAIGAIDPTNGKKDQKAQNPLNKNKESRQDSNTTLGAKAANTKITKPGTQRQMKSNSNQLASASKEDWYGTTNIEESLIMYKEHNSRSGDTCAEMEIDPHNTSIENLHTNPPTPKMQTKETYLLLYWRTRWQQTADWTFSN